ncbi:hypothetical protein WANA34_1357 [Wolbachia endosymbiont of Drosophila ananassae]|nr:hypothetical protein WANA34_1357 [Wolbachia endosymbiont of Drosophila ananassae]
MSIPDAFGFTISNLLFAFVMSNSSYITYNGEALQLGDG